MFKAKSIIKAIGDSNLELVNGNGYWYFILDSVEQNIFETHSVYTMYLNSLSFDRWVGVGKDFIEEMKKERNYV